MAPCTCIMCLKSLAGTLNAELERWVPQTDDEQWAEFGQMVPGDVSATPEEVKALRDFAEAYRTENPIPAPEAARSLMSLDESRIPCDDESNDKGCRIGWMLWEAMDMVHHQPALVAIIDAVMAMPRLEATPEQERRLGPELLEKWRTLQEFWVDMWGELGYRCWEGRYPREQDKGGGFASAGLACVSAFAAHRLAMHPPKITRSNELNMAFRTIVYALELDPWNHAPPGRVAAADLPRERRWGQYVSEQYITMLDTNVHALVPFIDIAGDVIYEWTDGRTQLLKFNPGVHPKDSIEYWRAQLACIKGRHPEADLWDTDERVTRERWRFWKARLVRVSSQSELMQRTRDEATMAVQMMEDIERRAAQPSQSAV